MSRRLIRTCLAATLLLAILTGCGTKPAPSPPPGPGGQAPAPAKIKVGLVTDVGGLEDASFNAAAWRGLKQLEDEGLVTPTAIESHKPEDYINNLTTFAETSKQDLTWAIGFLMTDALEQVAKSHTDAKFGLIDGVVDLPNVASILFKEHEGSFLMGILAARSTTSKVVGFIGGEPGDVIGRFESGFRAGVKYADPSVDVKVFYAGAFDDPAKGKEATNTLVAQGADVIFHASGYTGVGVIAAAQEKNIKAIGVDSDQHHLAPDTVISSMIKRVDVAVHEVSKSVSDGNFKGGMQNLGLVEDGVGWSETTVFPSDAVKTEMETAKTAIINGQLTIPDKPDQVDDWVKNLKK